MATVDRWLLPDGIEEVLPPEAARIETARRRVLDLFQRWGYELVITPHVEFLESLLTGSGQDLDLRTFKVIDPLSGRQMGLRADITRRWPASMRIPCVVKGRAGCAMPAACCMPSRRRFPPRAAPFSSVQNCTVMRLRPAISRSSA